MKFIGIALAIVVVVAAGWLYSGSPTVYLIDASQEFPAGTTLDLWGLELEDGRYRVTQSISDGDGGYGIYGRRIGRIPWLDNCAVKVADDGDGYLISYDEDGRTHFMWSRFDPLESE